MLNVACFFGCVDWLPASREARLGVAPRNPSLLLRFGGVWVDVKFCVVLRVRRLVACVVGGSFRASRVVAFKVWGVCRWMLNLVLFFARFVWLPASREARLGRRVSLHLRFGGCVGGC